MAETNGFSSPFKGPSIEGMHVIVTGAAGGIGKATALLLAHAGGKISCLDFADPTPVAEEINKYFGAGRAAAATCDVRKSDSVNAAIKQLVDAMGPFDGAANLAGVIGKDRKVGTTDGQIMEMTDEEWDRVMGVNINGVKNCVRAELQNFSTKGGSIVNAASVAGQEGVPFNSAYGASKAGVISLCKSVAKEVAPRNIRVNAICPGVVDTNLMRNIADKATLYKFATRAALTRPALPEEIGQVIFWLLSDHSQFCTAAVFNVDGGW